MHKSYAFYISPARILTNFSPPAKGKNGKKLGGKIHSISPFLLGGKTAGAESYHGYYLGNAFRLGRHNLIYKIARNALGGTGTSPEGGVKTGIGGRGRGDWTTRRPPDDRKETQTTVLWSCFPFIRSGPSHLARHSERGKKTRQTEEEMGRQHQGMDRPGVRQVPEGRGEQGKMDKTGCKIICGAPTTHAVRGLMMMMIPINKSSETSSRE